MELKNFTQANQDPLRPSGPCEAGGHPAHCFFDRSAAGLAWITLRFSMEQGAPLPEFAQGVTELEVAGTAVPVRTAKLKCGAQALQGSIDPALVEAAAGPAAPPEPPSDPPAAPVPPSDPPAGEGVAGGPSADPAPVPANPVLAKCRAWQDASAASAAAAEKVRVQRRLARTLRQQLEEAEEDLAELEGELPQLQAAAAGLRQELRDALDAEDA